MQDYPTDELRQASPSMFDAQNDKVKTTIEVLSKSREDLREEWTKECFDVVIEAMKEKEAMH